MRVKTTVPLAHPTGLAAQHKAKVDPSLGPAWIWLGCKLPGLRPRIALLYTMRGHLLLHAGLTSSNYQYNSCRDCVLLIGNRLASELTELSVQMRSVFTIFLKTR